VPNSVGRWTLPGGGIEFGEHPEAAAIRECQEETGLNVRIEGFAKVDSELFQFQEEPLQAIRILYRAEIVGGSLASEVEGSTDLCDWFTLDQCRQLPLVGLVRNNLDLAFS
jgi:ADP-ribose pyrophosphatase YjhB (NUDIX family)